MVRKRFWLIGVLLLLGLFLLGLMTQAHAQAPWQKEWEKVLAAAHKEGQVNIGGPPGDVYRAALVEEFLKKYPRIRVEWDGASGREKMPRIVRERETGIFNWDLYIGGSGSPLRVLKPIGAFDPLKTEVILPDVLDDKHWFEGFNAGFVDSDGKLIYAFDGTRQDIVYVNRDIVSEKEFNSFKDLADPKWAGKIVWEDPRREGSGLNTALLFRLSYGDDFLRKLLTEQKITFTLDRRQMTEWVVRGKYPIAISLAEDQLKIFLEKGVGTNVKPLAGRGIIPSYSQGFGSVAVFNRRPHPNATKVYLNWLLSKEGQVSWVTHSLGRNSRRTDVPPGDPPNALEPGVAYKNTQSEEFIPGREDIMRFAKELIR